jgi:uncharacterized membrane protein
MNHFVRTFLSGFLLLLPLVITGVLVVWLATFIYGYVGPGSQFGHVLIGIGFGFTASSVLAYLIGILVLAGGVYILGLIVESRLRHSLANLIDSLIRRIPLVRSVYDLTKRFVALVDQRDPGGLKGMRPVWCFFGGEGGVAVLALLPTAEVFTIEGTNYHAVLIPSAPVPVGGGLIYVPTEWIKPASIGVEGLMSVYISMGVSSPMRGGMLPAAKPPASLADNAPARGLSDR